MKGRAANFIGDHFRGQTPLQKVIWPEKGLFRRKSPIGLFPFPLLEKEGVDADVSRPISRYPLSRATCVRAVREDP